MINFYLLFLMYHWNPCIDESMQSSIISSPLSPSLDASIFSPQVYLTGVFPCPFEECFEYLPWITDLVFLLLLRFLLQCLVLRSFLVLLIFFFHLLLFDDVCFQYSQVILLLSKSCFFSDLAVLFFPLFLFSRFSCSHSSFLNTKFHPYYLDIHYNNL